MAVSNVVTLAGAFLLTDTDVLGTSGAAIVAKASSAVLYELEMDNTANGAATFLKLYNTGTVTVGTTVPDWVIMVPASVSRTLVVPSGLTFGTALSYAACTVGGTTGTTSPTSDFALKIVYV